MWTRASSIRPSDTPGFRVAGIAPRASDLPAWRHQARRNRGTLSSRCPCSPWRRTGMSASLLTRSSVSRHRSNTQRVRSARDMDGSPKRSSVRVGGAKRSAAESPPGKHFPAESTPGERSLGSKPPTRSDRWRRQRRLGPGKRSTTRQTNCPGRRQFATTLGPAMKAVPTARCRCRTSLVLSVTLLASATCRPLWQLVAAYSRCSRTDRPGCTSSTIARTGLALTRHLSSGPRRPTGQSRRAGALDV